MRTALLMLVLTFVGTALFSQAAAQTFQVGPEIVTRGDSLKVALKLPPGAAGEAKLQLVWTDSYGRIVADEARDVKLAGDALAFELPLARSVAMLNQLSGKLTAGGKSFDIPKADFVVTPDGAWDDYAVIMYYPYKTPQQQLALRDAGINAGQIQSGRTQDPNGARHWWANDYRYYCDQIIYGFLAPYHTPAKEPKDAELKAAKGLYKQLKGEGKSTIPAFVRKPSFHDPEARAAAMARMKAAAQSQARFKPYFYSTDECGVANLVEAWDFDFDPRALDAFRTWLLKQYGSLDAINAQWGTKYEKLEQVMPATTDETMARADWNLSAWADHRHFMNQAFADAVKEAGDAARSADPTARSGIVGGQMPAAFGGYDYWLLSKAMEAVEPYNIGNNREIWRSFAPRKQCLTTGFGAGPMEIWRLWYQGLHGDMGLIIYDEKNVYLDEQGKPTALGAGIAPTYKELTGGVAKQLWAMQRQDDPIAIHYSQPSITGQWMIEVRPQGGAWVNRGSATERKNSPFLRLRESWVRLPEDSSLGYYFVSQEQLASGEMDKNKAKVLILPQSVAMSKAECDAVKRFVEAGGTAIADARLALMDEHCRMMDKGQLDEFFGITRADQKYQPGPAGLKLVGKSQDPLLPYAQYPKAQTAEPGIKAAEGGQAWIEDSKGTPAVIVRKQGKGRTVYLNLAVHDYHLWRMKPPEGEPLRQLVNTLFQQAGVKAPFTVGPADKFASVITELHEFKSGDLQVLGLHRNYQIRTNELGPPEYQKQEALEQPLEVTVNFGKACHVYDQRAGKYLGNQAEMKLPLDRYQPTILSLLPGELKAVKVDAPPKAARGSLVEAKFQLDGAHGDAHALRVKLLGPDGAERRMLTRNILSDKAGRAVTAIPIAASDPPGEWKLVVTDVPTGVTAQHALTVE